MVFTRSDLNISDNEKLREPQRGAYAALKHAAKSMDDRELGVILPVGCGKSGCIVLTPFAFGARRILVIAPNLAITEQLVADHNPSEDQFFLRRFEVLGGTEYPEPVEIRSNDTNRSDLEESDVVITNIHQLQGAENRWLSQLPSDFFDLIIFDEGHHTVAESWQVVKSKFPDARIVNFSATPERADGQLMAGKFVYTYSVAEAIQAGLVKRLKAVVLNPQTLKYVRQKDGEEIEVDLDEVRRLGEDDSDFRRSIVTSQETLNTIVDASIRELRERRSESGDDRLKIIASALNYAHCSQIVSAYQQRGLRAGYVHSKERQPANDRVLEKLKNHEIDVIVQVRKLGEGFDHPYLAVAAVFSIFANLSPFVQFVGRIMRVVKQDAPEHPLNQGVVVFHAGANIASRWDDFRSFSAADQAYFDQLLPLEGIDPDDHQPDEKVIEPDVEELLNSTEVRSQSQITLEEINLLDVEDDAEAKIALETLKAKGYTGEEVSRKLDSIPLTKQNQRRAARKRLDRDVIRLAGQVLRTREVPAEGSELDTQFLGRSNFVVFKSAIDRAINSSVERQSKERHELSLQELEEVIANLGSIVERVEQEVFGGEA